jgi:hypothetical protein
MQPIQNAFKHHKARKAVVYGGAVIMLAITVLSCVSSFMIYVDGFRDMPFVFQQTLALFAVLVVEGAFIWLVFGFTRAFSSALERLIAIAGIALIVAVMLFNLVTHFMMAKNVELHRYQQTWVEWGAVTVFIAVLIIVLLITLADPIARLIRLELRYQGKQQETILTAKSEALESERIMTAMANRANAEAERLAEVIAGDAGGFPREIDADSRYRSGHRERLEIPAQKKDIAKTYMSSNSEGLRRLREALKDISFRLPNVSFKTTVNPDNLWIRAMKANQGTQETVHSVSSKLSILDDAVSMPRDEFRERLERFLRKNGFQI